MHLKFDEYSKAVARYVRHATGKEKANLRKELEDHMEDHAQALLDGGFPEDHAYRAAVESMGDPEEVGKALNREYPLRWLILSRSLLVVALILLVLLISWSSQTWHQWEPKLNARTPSLETMQAVAGPVLLHPLDLSQPINDDVTLAIYGVGLWQQEDGSYSAYVCSISYPNSIFGTAGDLPFRLHFFSDETALPHGAQSGTQNNSVNDIMYYISLPEYGIPLSVRYDSHGTTFDLEIPLPWEEVAP